MGGGGYYENFGLGPDALLSRGALGGAWRERKFGRAVVNTSYTPLCFGGVHRMIQPAAATALRVKAGGNANDTADGSGAREVTLWELSATGAYQSSALATAGASVSANSAETYIRLLRIKVTKSGTYGAVGVYSHAGPIVIERAAGSQDWGTIDGGSPMRSQSEIGCYATPLGYGGFIERLDVWSDTAHSTDVILFRRDNLLQSAAPYEALRAIQAFEGVKDRMDYEFSGEGEYLPPLTDLVVMAKVAAGTGAISCRMAMKIIPEAA